MASSSLTLSRPSVARRVPVQVNLTPEFLAALTRLEQSSRHKPDGSDGYTVEPIGLVFGTIRERSVTAHSVSKLDGYDTDAFADSEGFPPGSQIGRKLLSLKGRPEFASFSLIGWCLIGQRSGLLQSDLQFHNRHFRRLSDFVLLVRMDGEASWGVELYTRAFSGSLSPANHLASGSWFSPFGLPEYDVELVPGRLPGKQRPWLAKFNDLRRFSRVAVRSAQPGLARARTPVDRSTRQFQQFSRPLATKRARKALLAIAAGLLVAGVTLAVLVTNRPTHVSRTVSRPPHSAPLQAIMAPKLRDSVIADPSRSSATTAAQKTNSAAAIAAEPKSVSRTSMDRKLRAARQPRNVLAPSTAPEKLIDAPKRDSTARSPVTSPIVKPSDPSAHQPELGVTKPELSSELKSVRTEKPKRLEAVPVVREPARSESKTADASAVSPRASRQQERAVPARTVVTPGPITPGIVAARPLRQVIPQSSGPGLALYRDVDVPVQVVVSPTGQVSSALPAVREQVSQAVIGAALEAAKQWVFQPATQGGRNVESKYTITFRFHARH